ncbi:hypothetical protein SNEBB_004326 [Seison nebaliae]|nr:hypothetical protein SNEBB_004326 [Seison nebaliae]
MSTLQDDLDDIMKMTNELDQELPPETAELIHKIVQGIRSDDSTVGDKSFQDAEVMLQRIKEEKKSRIVKKIGLTSGLSNSLNRSCLDTRESLIEKFGDMPPEQLAIMQHIEADAQDRLKKRGESEVLAEEMRKKGNQEFKNKNYKYAILYYSQGIAILKDHRVLYTNRSLAYMRIGRLKEACKDAEMSLRIDHKCEKGHILKLKCLVRMNKKKETINGLRDCMKECSMNGEKLKKFLVDYWEEIGNMMKEEKVTFVQLEKLIKEEIRKELEEDEKKKKTEQMEDEERRKREDQQDMERQQSESRRKRRNLSQSVNELSETGLSTSSSTYNMKSKSSSTNIEVMEDSELTEKQTAKLQEKYDKIEKSLYSSIIETNKDCFDDSKILNETSQSGNCHENIDENRMSMEDTIKLNESRFESSLDENEYHEQLKSFNKSLGREKWNGNSDERKKRDIKLLKYTIFLRQLTDITKTEETKTAFGRLKIIDRVSKHDVTNPKFMNTNTKRSLTPTSQEVKNAEKKIYFEKLNVREMELFEAYFDFITCISTSNPNNVQQLFNKGVLSEFGLYTDILLLLEVLPNNNPIILSILRLFYVLVSNRQSLHILSVNLKLGKLFGYFLDIVEQSHEPKLETQTAYILASLCTYRPIRTEIKNFVFRSNFSMINQIRFILCERRPLLVVSAFLFEILCYLTEECDENDLYSFINYDDFWIIMLIIIHQLNPDNSQMFMHNTPLKTFKLFQKYFDHEGLSVNESIVKNYEDENSVCFQQEASINLMMSSCVLNISQSLLTYPDFTRGETGKDLNKDISIKSVISSGSSKLFNSKTNFRTLNSTEMKAIISILNLLISLTSLPSKQLNRYALYVFVYLMNLYSSLPFHILTIFINLFSYTSQIIFTYDYSLLMGKEWKNMKDLDDILNNLHNPQQAKNIKLYLNELQENFDEEQSSEEVSSSAKRIINENVKDLSEENNLVSIPSTFQILCWFSCVHLQFHKTLLHDISISSKTSCKFLKLKLKLLLCIYQRFKFAIQNTFHRKSTSPFSDFIGLFDFIEDEKESNNHRDTVSFPIIVYALLCLDQCVRHFYFNCYMSNEKNMKPECFQSHVQSLLRRIDRRSNLDGKKTINLKTLEVAREIPVSVQMKLILDDINVFLQPSYDAQNNRFNIQLYREQINHFLAQDRLNDIVNFIIRKFFCDREKPFRRAALHDNILKKTFGEMALMLIGMKLSTIDDELQFDWESINGLTKICNFFQTLHQAKYGHSDKMIVDNNAHPEQ